MSWKAESWKPALTQGFDVHARTLSPVQQFVALKVDGAHDLEMLAAMTGLPLNRVSSVVNELVTVGAVVPHAVELAEEQEHPTDPEMQVVTGPWLGAPATTAPAQPPVAARPAPRRVDPLKITAPLHACKR
jgi:hypothetical protein